MSRTPPKKTSEAAMFVSAIEALIDARIEMVIPHACGGRLTAEALEAREKLIVLLGGEVDE